MYILYHLNTYFLSFSSSFIGEGNIKMSYYCNLTNLLKDPIHFTYAGITMHNAANSVEGVVFIVHDKNINFTFCLRSLVSPTQ